MARLSELADSAPLPVRLVPALLGAALALQVLGVPVRRALMPAVLLAVGGAVLVALVRHAGVGRRAAGGSWECFELIVSDDGALEGLRRFLEERSRGASRSFRIVEIFEHGVRRLLLSVRGPEGEGEVVATVISAMLRGSVRVKRIGACNGHEAVNINLRGLGVSEGVLLLGYDASSPIPREVYLGMRDIEGHIGVYGSTGSGKSTTLQVLATRAPRSLRVVVIDWTGEHASGLQSRGFTVVRPEDGGLDIVACERDTGVVLELLSRALELTEPQVYMVEAALKRGASSLRQVYDIILGLPEESKWDREVKRALSRKLGTLLRSAGGAFSGAGCGVLGGERVVVDLSGIVEAYSRRALANLYLAMLFLESRRGAPRTLVVIDEAHNLIGSEGRSILNIILAEARKFGLHVAYATQSPATMGDLALLNTNTKIVHSLKSQRDKRVIVDSMGLSEEWAQKLDKLQKGEALIQSPSHPEPILVSIQP